MSIRSQRSSWLLGTLVALVGATAASTATAASFPFVQQGTPLWYLKGTQTPDASWTSRALQETSPWVASSAGFGIGYGDGDDNTVLSDMSGSYLTVYVRTHFQVGAELASLKKVTLQAAFDDGFVAYLNGTEVGRASVPAGPLSATSAASDHEVTAGDVSFDIDPSLLVQGDNVLAVEVHNVSLTSSDLSFIPTLLGEDATPTPTATITLGPFLQQVKRTSALIVWETDEPAPSVVSFGPTPALGQSVEDTAEVLHHVVMLDGLQPASAVYYQVDSAKVASQVGQLFTEHNLADPFRIAFFGDTRSNTADHASVVAGLVADKPTLVLHSGDLVEDGSIPGQWDQFFTIEQNLVRDAALYPVLGNHEGTGPNYTNIFELPADTTAPERYYAFRYGPLFIVGLDEYTNPYGSSSAEYGWLEQQLASAAQDPFVRHKIVQLHAGPYDSGAHGSNMTVRSDLVPLFEKYGVELVISGHDHDYERGTVNGVKYVVSGGGGAPRYSVPGDWWTEAAESTLHYCIADVLGPRMDITCKRPDGSVLDHFILGDGLSECSVATDCASLSHGQCTAPEQGAWECVANGCVWNCVAPAPSPPDGGAGGATQDAGPADAAAGASGQGAGGSGVPELAPAGDQGDSSSCACRTAGVRSHADSRWWLLALGAIAVGRRRSRSPLPRKCS